MQPTDGKRETFEDFAIDLLRRIEEQGWSAYDAALRARPEHAAKLERRVRALIDAGLLEAASGGGPGEGRDPDRPRQLGGFRILATLGAGGMGIVYRAEEIALRREVALKLVRPEQLYFPGARQRFEREVAIVAGLQHPGIVPVYSFGEADGVPFFTMECMRGATLGDVLDRLVAEGVEPAALEGSDLARVLTLLERGGGTPVDAAPGLGEVAPAERGDEPPAATAQQRALASGSWSAAVAALGRAVAEALEHAHRRGVLHRDVKPSNVMLTLDGRAMLLDFGLSASALADRLTRTGQQVGSLPYMPPEAFDSGVELDERGDVYSLGVMLYELLTLRLPFREASTADLVRAIEGGAPQALRTLNTRVPRDLETVVATAMEADPRRRYATAAELARDLSNVLEARPIEARRSGAAHRLRLWARRRPAAATAASALLLAVVVGPSTLAWQQHRANVVVRKALDDAQDARATAQSALGVAREERDRAEQARAEAERERDSAREARELSERSYERAIEAVDAMLVQVGDQALVEIPGMERVRRELLEEALRLHQEIATENEGDREQHRRVARTLHRTASIYGLLGQFDQALAALARERELLEGLLAGGAEAAASAEHRGDLLVALASTWNSTSEVYRLTERLPEAEDAARQGSTVLRELAPDHTHYAELRGRLEVQLAWTLGQRGAAEEARTMLSGAVTALEGALAGLPEVDWEAAEPSALRSSVGAEAFERIVVIQRVLAKALKVLGQGSQLFFRTGEGPDLASRVAHLERAQALQAGVAAASGALADRKELADIQNVLGTLYMGQGRAPQAREVFEHSAAQFERLATDFPSAPYYRDALGTACMNLVTLARYYEQRPGWGDDAARAARLFEALGKEHPESVHFVAMRFFATVEVAASGLEDGEVDLALTAEAAREAESLAEQLAARGVGAGQVHEKRLHARWLLAAAESRAGRSEQAHEAVRSWRELAPGPELCVHGVTVLADAIHFAVRRGGEQELVERCADLAAQLWADARAGGVELATLTGTLTESQRTALAAQPRMAKLFESVPVE